VTPKLSATLILFLTFGFLAPGTTEAAVVRFYMSPDSDEERDEELCGESEEQPVTTLNRIHDCLHRLKPTQEIEIHIRPGLYRGQRVKWTYVNGRPITFTSHGFGKERPVFDGDRDNTCDAIRADEHAKDVWFRLEASSGERTNLRFRYIRVQNYDYAVEFHGNREDPHGGWNGGNALYGMYFYRIGGWYGCRDYSTAVVAFVNSRFNSVANSHFVKIGQSVEPRKLHALYIAHHSLFNSIVRNRFEDINGEPIKVRDASNFNHVNENVFRWAGRVSYFEDHFCREDCKHPSRECPSMGNEFRNNDLYGGYLDHGGSIHFPIAVAKLHFPDDACGPLYRPRLYRSGNVTH
jgi:hypothetical protein